MLGKNCIKKKKIALVVLLWASPRVHMSVNVTAWVGDDAAVGQGHGQPLPELQSSFSNGGGGGGHQNPALPGQGHPQTLAT